MKQGEANRLASARADARSGEAKTLRIGAGFTQAEVGSICGVTPAAISRWEDGRRIPRGEPALRYARFLASLRSRVAS